MSINNRYVQAMLLIVTLLATPAIAVSADCHVAGGGMVGRSLNNFPSEIIGPVQFAVTVTALESGPYGYCDPEEVRGVLQVRMDDGSRFVAVEFHSASFITDGFDWVSVLGTGLYEGTLVNFQMALLDWSSVNPDDKDELVLEFYDESNEVTLRVNGWVNHGSIRIDR